jgi:hypothetical protein
MYKVRCWYTRTGSKGQTLKNPWGAEVAGNWISYGRTKEEARTRLAKSVKRSLGSLKADRDQQVKDIEAQYRSRRTWLKTILSQI